MKRIPVAILGATGMVGQRLIQRLANHPQFEVVAVAASARSAGKPYRQATTWRLPGESFGAVGDQIVLPCTVEAMPKGGRIDIYTDLLGADDENAAAFVKKNRAEKKEAGHKSSTGVGQLGKDATP